MMEENKIFLNLKGAANCSKQHLSKQWYLFVRWLIFKTARSQTAAYRRWINYRINTENAKEAVGGKFDEIGKLQFDFLQARGLNTSNTLLDLGCGSLRGGKHFIEYLEPEKYTGMDVSETIIEEGQKIIGKDIIQEKKPRFIVNNDLSFSEIKDSKPFDYMIAQSVFTHLPWGKIAECFSNLNKVLGEHSVFYATFFKDEAPDTPKDFSYSYSELTQLGAKNGLEVDLISRHQYPHPRSQRMLEIRVVE